MAKRIWRAARTGQSTVDNLQTHPARREILRVKSLRRGRKENEGKREGGTVEDGGEEGGEKAISKGSQLASHAGLQPRYVSS